MSCSLPMQGQIVKVGIGDYTYKSNIEAPIVNGYQPSLETPVFTFSIEKQIKRMNFRVGYSTFKGWTNFKVNSPIWNGVGYHATDLERYFFDLGFVFFDLEKGANIIPYIGIISESSRVLAEKFTGFVLEQGIDPNYQGFVTVESFERTQLIPSVGIDFNLQLPFYFTASFNVHYSFGRERFQEQVFVYSYQGKPQPDGIVYEDGTGLFMSVLIGFNLSKIKLYDGDK